MHHPNLFGGVIKFVNRLGGADLHVHAARVEVAVAQWRVDEYRPGRDASEQFGKIEGDVPRPLLIIEQAGHVAFTRPTPDISPFVVFVRIKPATGHHQFDTRIEDSCINGIMSAEGMTDRAESLLRHKWK